MIFKSYDDVMARISAATSPRRLAIAAAEDMHTIEAVIKGKRDSIIEPVLIGNRQKIEGILVELEQAVSEYEIIETVDDEASALMAVQMIREGKADFLMKGRLETAKIMRPVINKETGIGQGRVISHFGMMQLPGYHKLIVITDTGIVTSPTLEQKRDILLNAVDTLRAMGYDKPKVAVLAAVETVNPKMPETADAAELKQMNLNGTIPNCLVEGPISFDILMNREVAAVKGYSSPVVEDADILLVPDVTAGNLLSKALVRFAGARMIGFAVGAKVPLVITSRGSSVENKFMSLVIASAASTKA